MNIKSIMNFVGQWFAPVAKPESDKASASQQEVLACTIAQPSANGKPSASGKPGASRPARTKGKAAKRRAWWQARKAAAKAKRMRQQKAKAAQAKTASAQKPAARKPAYQLIPDGATLLIDTANLVNLLTPQHAAYKFETIEASLAARGFKTLFFVEDRAIAWMRYQQESQAERDALEAFCRKANVTKVGGRCEADLAILQAARAIPDSVCVTQDRYRDYAAAYPEIVGTLRHRSFSVAMLDDRILLSVVGLRDAIVIENKAPQKEAAFEEAVSENVPQDVLTEEGVAVEPDSCEEVSASVRSFRKGLLGVGDACREKGDVVRAAAFYGRAAKKDPSAYFDIADLYSDDEDGEAGYRRAVKFTRLGLESAKKLRERKLRQARLHAEKLRNGDWLHRYRRAA